MYGSLLSSVLHKKDISFHLLGDQPKNDQPAEKDGRKYLFYEERLKVSYRTSIFRGRPKVDIVDTQKLLRIA